MKRAAEMPGDTPINSQTIYVHNLTAAGNDDYKTMFKKRVCLSVSEITHDQR